MRASWFAPSLSVCLSFALRPAPAPADATNREDGRVTDRRPDALTLTGFVVIALLGGSNVVAVRLTNRELDPLWGAGSRFAAGSVLLLLVALVLRIRLPKGRALAGAALFGAVNFFGFFAFAYYGLQQAPAALGGVMIGMLPLITLILAVVQRVEAFELRALVGALIAVSGVVVIAGSPAGADVPAASVAALFAAAICGGEASILVKRFPPIHPIALNALAMPVGALLLLALSAASGEEWALPQRTTTWLTLGYVIPFGSVALFVIFVYVLNRWSASAVSYQFVFFPIVASLVGALVADEPLNVSIAIGAALAIAGVYIGALAKTRPEAAPAEPVG
jgi:drug/metabolite transporter (DMT)-like permease